MSVLCKENNNVVLSFILIQQSNTKKMYSAVQLDSTLDTLIYSNKIEQQFRCFCLPIVIMKVKKRNDPKIDFDGSVDLIIAIPCIIW